MSDNGLTSIVFLPICKECLNIIWQTVDYEKHNITGEEYDITPNKCPHCGRFIDSIVIPTKLPFNSSEYMSGVK